MFDRCLVRNEDMIIWKAPHLGYNVKTLIVSNQPREYPDDIKVSAEKHWLARKEINANLFDGPVWCMHSWRLEELSIILTIELTTYKYILYMLFNPGMAGIPPELRPNALGSSGITITSDGKIVLGRRKTNVGTAPSVWHLVPAGNVDSYDTIGHIKAELLEELAVTLNASDSLSVYGMFNAGKEQGEKTEMVFVIRLASISFEELCKRFKKLDPNANEHEKLIGVTKVPHDLPMTCVAKAVLSSYFT